MSLRAVYRATEDRIELFLDSENQATACWLTRRQWLGLLHQLKHTVLCEHNIEAAPAIAPISPPLTRSSPVSHLGLVSAIRVRQQPEQLTVLLTLGESVRAITLNAQQLKALITLLQKQAEVAGWDAALAMRRYQAARLTQELLVKARCSVKNQL